MRLQLCSSKVSNPDVKGLLTFEKIFMLHITIKFYALALLPFPHLKIARIYKKKKNPADITWGEDSVEHLIGNWEFGDHYSKSNVFHLELSCLTTYTTQVLRFHYITSWNSSNEKGIVIFLTVKKN